MSPTIKGKPIEWYESELDRRKAALESSGKFTEYERLQYDMYKERIRELRFKDTQATKFDEAAKKGLQVNVAPGEPGMTDQEFENLYETKVPWGRGTPDTKAEHVGNIVFGQGLTGAASSTLRGLSSLDPWAMVGARQATDNPMWKAADSIDEFANRVAPVNEEFMEESPFLMKHLPYAAASAATFMIPGGIAAKVAGPALAGRAAGATTGALGSLQSAGSMAEVAEDKDLPLWKRNLMTVGGAAVGATEALPGSALFGGFPAKVSQKLGWQTGIGGAAARGLAQAGVEGGQEFGQGVGENIVMNLAEPTPIVDKDTVLQGLAGAAIGLPMGMASPSIPKIRKAYKESIKGDEDKRAAFEGKVKALVDKADIKTIAKSLESFSDSDLAELIADTRDNEKHLPVRGHIGAAATQILKARGTFDNVMKDVEKIEQKRADDAGIAKAVEMFDKKEKGNIDRVLTSAYKKDVARSEKEKLKSTVLIETRKAFAAIRANAEKSLRGAAPERAMAEKVLGHLEEAAKKYWPEEAMGFSHDPPDPLNEAVGKAIEAGVGEMARQQAVPWRIANVAASTPSSPDFSPPHAMARPLSPGDETQLDGTIPSREYEKPGPIGSSDETAYSGGRVGGGARGSALWPSAKRRSAFMDSLGENLPRSRDEFEAMYESHIAGQPSDNVLDAQSVADGSREVALMEGPASEDVIADIEAAKAMGLKVRNFTFPGTTGHETVHVLVAKTEEALDRTEDIVRRHGKSTPEFHDELGEALGYGPKPYTSGRAYSSGTAGGGRMSASDVSVISAELKKIAPWLSLKFEEEMSRGGRAVYGSLLHKLVTISMDQSLLSGRTNLRHEVMHWFLRSPDSPLSTEEKAILMADAELHAGKTYGGSTDIEEAACDRYGSWGAGQEMPTLLDKIFRKIKRYLDEIAHAFGVKKLTPEMIWGRIESGSYRVNEASNATSPSSRDKVYAIHDTQKLPIVSDRMIAMALRSMQRPSGEKYIKDETKTHEDVENVGKQFLEDIASNPHVLAVKPDESRIDLRRVVTDADTGEQLDPMDPKNDLLLTDIGVRAAQAIRAGREDEARREIAKAAHDARARSIESVVRYLMSNPRSVDEQGRVSGYSSAEAGLVALVTSSYSASVGLDGSVKVVEINAKNDAVMEVDAELAAHIVDQIRAGKGMKEALKAAVLKRHESISRTMGGSNLTGWKLYPKSDKEEDAAELAKAVSGTGWCTASGASRAHRSRGDFWIYYENGKPEIGINLNGPKKLAEPPRGATNDQRLKPKHEDVARKFLEEHKEIDSAEFIRDAETMAAIRNYQKTGRLRPGDEKFLTLVINGDESSQLVESCKFVVPQAFLGYGNENNDVAVRAFVGDDMGDIIKEGHFPGSIETNSHVLDVRIKSIGGYLEAPYLRVADSLVSVGGFADIFHQLTQYAMSGGVCSARSLASVGGWMGAPSPADFGSLESVGGDAQLSEESNLTSLRRVGGSLFLHLPSSSDPRRGGADLRSLKSVGGDLFGGVANAPSLERVERTLSTVLLTEVPRLSYVGGRVDAPGLMSADSLEFVGGMLKANDLVSAPRLREVADDMETPNLGQADALESVGGFLWANNLRSAAKLTRVGFSLSVGVLERAPSLRSVGENSTYVKIHAPALYDAPLLDGPGYSGLHDINMPLASNAPLAKKFWGYLDSLVSSRGGGKGILDGGKAFSSARVDNYRDSVVKWAKKKFGSAKAPDGSSVADNFVAWFGDSKVVDENGEPLVVYHGTWGGDGFASFDTMSNKNEIGSHFGSGFTANAVVDPLGDGGSEGYPSETRIYPVFLSIQSPLRTADFYGSANGSALAVANALARAGRSDLAARLSGRLSGRRVEKYSIGSVPMSVDALDAAFQKPGAVAAEVRRTIFDAGYDGIVYENTIEGGGDSYIALKPSQIKSATGNNGEFSKSEGDIRFSHARVEDPPIFKRLPNPSRLKAVFMEWPDDIARYGEAGAELANLGRSVPQASAAHVGIAYEKIYHFAHGLFDGKGLNKQKARDQKAAIDRDIGLIIEGQDLEKAEAEMKAKVDGAQSAESKAHWEDNLASIKRARLSLKRAFGFDNPADLVEKTVSGKIVRHSGKMHLARELYRIGDEIHYEYFSESKNEWIPQKNKVSWWENQRDKSIRKTKDNLTGDLAKLAQIRNRWFELVTPMFNEAQDVMGEAAANELEDSEVDYFPHQVSPDFRLNRIKNTVKFRNAVMALAEEIHGTNVKHIESKIARLEERLSGEVDEQKRSEISQKLEALKEDASKSRLESASKAYAALSAQTLGPLQRAYTRKAGSVEHERLGVLHFNMIDWGMDAVPKHFDRVGGVIEKWRLIGKVDKNGKVLKTPEKRVEELLEQVKSEFDEASSKQAREYIQTALGTKEGWHSDQKWRDFWRTAHALVYALKIPSPKLFAQNLFQVPALGATFGPINILTHVPEVLGSAFKKNSKARVFAAGTGLLSPYEKGETQFYEKVSTDEGRLSAMHRTLSGEGKGVLSSLIRGSFYMFRGSEKANNVWVALAANVHIEDLVAVIANGGQKNPSRAFFAKAFGNAPMVSPKYAKARLVNTFRLSAAEVDKMVAARASGDFDTFDKIKRKAIYNAGVRVNPRTDPNSTPGFFSAWWFAPVKIFKQFSWNVTRVLWDWYVKPIKVEHNFAPMASLLATIGVYAPIIDYIFELFEGDGDDEYKSEAAKVIEPWSDGIIKMGYYGLMERPSDLFKPGPTVDLVFKEPGMFGYYISRRPELKHAIDQASHMMYRQVSLWHVLNRMKKVHGISGPGPKLDVKAADAQRMYLNEKDKSNPGMKFFGKVQRSVQPEAPFRRELERVRDLISRGGSSADISKAWMETYLKALEFHDGDHEKAKASLSSTLDQLAPLGRIGNSTDKMAEFQNWANGKKTDVKDIINHHMTFVAYSQALKDSLP